MKISIFVLVLSAQFSPFLSCRGGSQNVSGSYFVCPRLTTSGDYPTSVHRIKPSDIRVIGAMGDYVTTALGAFTESGNLRYGNLSEHRGFSWSGGEANLHSNQVAISLQY